jgi:hypothetical protein
MCGKIPHYRRHAKNKIRQFSQGVDMKFSVVGQSETKQLLRKFEQLTGKGIETGIKEMALSTSRQLATKMQPYGISDKGKAAKFLQNIEKQVAQVWFGINLGAYPESTDLKSSHYALRRNGRIRGRKFRKEKGNWWRGLITEDERDRYAKEQQAKAGRAKAAWIAAGNSLGVGKASKIGRWIQRHVGSGWASATVMDRGLNAKVELANNTPYLTGVQKQRDVAAALRAGRTNGIKRMRIIVDKQTKKIAKAS